MNGATTYNVIRIIDGVKVEVNVSAFPVGQAPDPSKGLGLVRTANGSDGRELVNIIGDTIDGVLEALERPEFTDTETLIKFLREQGVFI